MILIEALMVIGFVTVIGLSVHAAYKAGKAVARKEDEKD